MLINYNCLLILAQWKRAGPITCCRLTFNNDTSRISRQLYKGELSIFIELSKNSTIQYNATDRDESTNTSEDRTSKIHASEEGDQYGASALEYSVRKFP